MYRYLVLVWNPQSLESVRALQSFGINPTTIPTEWRVAWEESGVLALHTGTRRGATGAYPFKHDAGIVLGTLFDRQRGARHQIPFDESETRAVVASGGQHLIQRYWGSYLAVVRDASEPAYHVFRDPTGTLPCYRTACKGVEVFFSHIEDRVRLLRLRCEVNRRYLARWLLYTSLMTRDTGLEGVEELPGGERVTLSAAGTRLARLWDPAAIARTACFERPDEAAKAVRSTVQSTIDAWASCYEDITLKLSGGLDSSIVAGCLAQAPTRPHVTYLNFAIDAASRQEPLHMPGLDRRTAEKLRAIAGHGDERYFARLVADRWNVPLVERQRTNDMDLARLWQAPLSVGPPLYFSMMEIDDVEIEIARTRGTQAFFSGQAGDSVFLATLQPLPAIDFVWQHGIGRGLWEHLTATAALCKESVWTVLAKAMKYGLLRRPYGLPASVLDRPTAVRQELIADLTDDDFEGEWVNPQSLSALPPGKCRHVKGLAGSIFHRFVFYSGGYAEHIDPLNSQPIWELMLRIPTYTALTGGVNRGLARRAFADLLPREIRLRQSKGTGMPFYQQLVRRNLSFIRERLLDGLLVQHGYLDRQKLVSCLTSPEPFMQLYAPSLLAYLSAEGWLRQWADSGDERMPLQRPAIL